MFEKIAKLKTKIAAKFKKSSRMALREQIAWAEHLAILLRAGISMGEALRLMIDVEKKERLREVTRRILEDVDHGVTLADSFRKRGDPRESGRLFIRCISIGEMSGLLPDMIAHACAQYRGEEEVRRKMLGAMIYPACIGMVTFGIAGFLVLYIFPKVMPLFMSMHVVLPLPTRMLLWSSTFLKEYGLILVLAAAAGGALFSWAMRRKPRFRRLVESALFKLPIVGGLSKVYAHVSVFGILSMLMRHGIPLSQALAEVSALSSFLSWKDGFSYAADETEKGKSLATSLPDFFSSETVGLIRLAERTGDLEHIFEHISKSSLAATDRIVATLTRLVEPALMLGMGLVVGSISLSIIMPIYEITNHLK